VGKLPQVGKYLGKTVKEFRKGQHEIDEAMKGISPDKGRPAIYGILP
jgi:Sec-independent protein translocase protein TatA